MSKVLQSRRKSYTCVTARMDRGCPILLGQPLLEFAFANSPILVCAFAHILACGKDGSCHIVAFLEFASQTLRFKCALSRTSLPAARMGSTAKPAHASEEHSDECGGWSESGMLDSLVFGWFQTSQKAAHIKKSAEFCKNSF